MAYISLASIKILFQSVLMFSAMLILGLPHGANAALSRSDLIDSANGAVNEAPFDETTASFTPPNNSLLVVVFAGDNQFGSDIRSGITISGGGLTWTRRLYSGETDGGSYYSTLEVWTAPVTTGASMTVNAAHAGGYIGTAFFQIFAYTGYDTDSPLGVSTSTNAVTPTDGAGTMTITSGSPESTSAVIAGRLFIPGGAIPTASPGTGWNEIYDRTSGDGNLQTMERLNDTSQTIAWTDIRVGGSAPYVSVPGFALEIKAAPASTGTSLSKPPNNLGLIGYWSFDEGTSTVATDFSGNNKSGTLSTTGVTLPSWVYGKRRSAIEFDGTDDYINVGNVASNVKTISFWINADDTTSRKIMDIDGTDQIELDGSSQVTATSFPGTTAIYVDGSSASSVVGSGWHHVVITDTTGVSASTVDIGRVAGGYFDGNIDEVRMYSRILSIGEIESLRRLGAAKFSSSVELQRGSSLETGLVGHWTFDGADTQQTITDRSGEGNHGYYNGGATSSAYTIGKFGQALSFNSVSQYVSLPTYDSLRSTDGSVSAWVKTTVDNNGTIFSATHLCCAADGLDISIGGSVTAFCTNELISVNTDAAGARECYTTANRAELFDGNWHHIVVTTDSSTHIYLDGVAKIVTNGNGADPGTFTNIHGGMDEFSIGAYISTAGGDCCSVQGKLDDVRVYNRTLSANEVKQLYNLGRAVIRN